MLLLLVLHCCLEHCFFCTVVFFIDDAVAKKHHTGHYLLLLLPKELDRPFFLKSIFWNFLRVYSLARQCEVRGGLGVEGQPHDGIVVKKNLFSRKNT